MKNQLRTGRQAKQGQMLSSTIKSLVIYWQGLVTLKKILEMLKERNPCERIKMKIEKCVLKHITYSKNFIIIIIIINILYYITLIYCSPSYTSVFQILISCSPLYTTIQPEKASCFRATQESILHNPKSLVFGGQYNASLTDLTYSFSGMESILSP